MSPRALALACLFLLGCGPQPGAAEPALTVGARIGDISDICMVERTHIDGALGWAYGVCVDPACSQFRWVYADEDGMYLGESEPAYADKRCYPPGASPYGPVSLKDRIGGRRICASESIAYQGGMATAYAVCADAVCSQVVWLYGDGDLYLGESHPVPAPASMQCGT